MSARLRDTQTIFVFYCSSISLHLNCQKENLGYVSCVGIWGGKSHKEQENFFYLKKKNKNSHQS